MKFSTILVIPSLILLPGFPVLAADGIFEGEISVSGTLTDVDGSNAKFNEYRDISDGLGAGLWLNYDSEKYFITGEAADVGSDTQQYGIEGNRYGSFKAYFDYYEIPHNFTFGAKTFYSGVGTNNLVITADPDDPATWKSFDYATKRKTYEGGFSLDHFKPFFFEFSTPNEKRTGTYPIGATLGDRGGPMVELPQPIDYTTNTVNMTAGYAQNPYFAAVNFFYNQFNNDNSALFFERPNDGAVGAYSLPPDNEAYKLAFKGSAKLPYNSQFSVNLATGRAQSDDNILLSPTNIFGPVFNGEVNTNNYDFVLITNPVRLLRAKIDYKYYERDNQSDQLEIDGVTNELFSYKKNKFGIDLGWTLPAKFSLGTAYTYLKTDREFVPELPENQDNIFSAELKWRGLNFMTPKLRYERLQRTADREAVDAETHEALFWRYDVASKDQDTIKATVDIFPYPNWNLMVGYKYTNVDYSETILGLKSTQSNQVNLDAGYTLGKIAQFNAYFDVEIKKDYQVQGNNTPEPDWDVAFRDKGYTWGAGSEFYLVPDKITLLLQYDSVNSNGEADFTLFGADRDNEGIDIGNWDDYRLNYYSAKVRYTPTKQYTFTVGYAYERFKYNDAQFDNYVLLVDGNLLSGAYADPDYDAHVVFVTASYKF